MVLFYILMTVVKIYINSNLGAYGPLVLDPAEGSGALGAPAR